MSKKQKHKSQPKPTIAPPRKWGVARFVTGLLATAATVAVLATFYHQFLEHPDIHMRIDFTNVRHEGDEILATIHVAAENRTAKRADDFYWHLIIPEESVISVNLPGANLERQRTHDERKILHFQGHVALPLDRMVMTFLTGDIAVPKDTKPFSVSWQIGCCGDRIYPPVLQKIEEGKAYDVFGKIRIDLTRISR